MRSLANVPRSSDNHIGREELKMDRLVTDVLVIGGGGAALRAALAACDAGAAVSYTHLDVYKRQHGG